MADRFPSLEELNSEESLVAAITGTGSPAKSDFLERERAVLGVEVTKLGSPTNNSTTSTLHPRPTPNGTHLTNKSTEIMNASTDLFDEEIDDNMAKFETSFPAIDSVNEPTLIEANVTSGQFNKTLPIRNASESTRFTDEALPSHEFRERHNEIKSEIFGSVESPPMREWCENFRQKLQEKKKIETQQEEKAIKEAQETIDEFYVSYNSKKEKGISQTRKEAEEFLASRETTTSGGTSWERISKLVDLNSAKGSMSNNQDEVSIGKERFRELLLDLRKEAKAPGATGV